MQEAPKLDSRSGEQLFQSLTSDLKNRLDIDAAREDPLARALLRVFARYCELIIQRLNRVPDKNLIAFLDVLNVSRMPPVPAQVPLTFTPVKKLSTELSRASGAIVVPAYTKVAAAPGEGESDPTVYETTRALALTNIELSMVLAHDPPTDRYTDKSALATLTGGPGDFAFDAREPVEHEFYIGHDPMLGKSALSELRLLFEINSEGAIDAGRHSITWWIPAPDGKVTLIPTRDTTSQLTQSGEVVFNNLPEWPAYKVLHRDMSWLGCKLMDPLPARTTPTLDQPSTQPLIRSLTMFASWQVEEAAVETAFFNNLPLDLSKDFFPLGERPRFGDVWYLSCGAFAKPHARIRVKITLTNPATGGSRAPIPAVRTVGQPHIQWEYWDGRRWSTLLCEDGTEAFTEDGEVVFLVPSPFPPTTVNGIEDCWIRARLVAGNYGEDERIEFSSQDQGLRRIPSTLAPPSVQSVAVTSSLTVGPELPECIVTNNNFAYEEINGAMPFQPFRAAADPQKALYLGFKVPDEARHALHVRPLDLYFQISGSRGRALIRDAMGLELPSLTWQYWNGQAWTRARLEDATESLTTPGIVSLGVGEDMALWRESSRRCGLHWLRVLWIAGEFEGFPTLSRILLNTVPATQTTTLQDELLGSSNGLPNQLFRSARAPILDAVQLEVREPDMPAEAELASVYREEGAEAVTTIRDAQGRIERIWVRWHEVSDFLSSSTDDRHFIVDRLSGEIRFGDGTHGLIPPVGANNVRLHSYHTGGGAVGNKPAGSITQLRSSVPYVDSVMNLEPALGGQDGEPWESVQARGTRWLRHRGRAVTLEDYEDLAQQASPSVARVKGYPNRDLAVDPAGRSITAGIISLIIVPHSQDPRPWPELTLLRHLRNFLNERRAQDTELVLVAPEYVGVSIEAVVIAATTLTSADIITQCETAVGRYLHPLTGGPDGKGWHFGQRPHESDFYALLESIRGVDHVESLAIRMTEDHPGLVESETFLICAGDPKIRLG